MKIYNSSAMIKMIVGVAYILFLCLSAAIPLENPRDYKYYLIFVLFTLTHIILFGRDIFCPFIIDEKGITNKLIGWNYFISWSEVEHIYVGERRDNGYISPIICFSKKAHKRVSDNPINFVIQTRRRLYITYKDGMLDEILKYIEKNKIDNVELLSE